tara:strand:- start:4909 stop:5289 length:381 start_codon:yes stop_codon:yes gene_type:complete
LNDVADLVVHHIYNEMDSGKDINGKRFKRLKQSTIDSKRKKGAKRPESPLIDEDIMRAIYRDKTATPNKLRSRVTVAKKREVIAEYHNEGEGNLPKREFFGIGKTVKPKMDKLVKLRLVKVLRTIK